MQSHLGSGIKIKTDDRESWMLKLGVWIGRKMAHTIQVIIQFLNVWIIWISDYGIKSLLICSFEFIWTTLILRKYL